MSLPMDSGEGDQVLGEPQHNDTLDATKWDLPPDPDIDADDNTEAPNRGGVRQAPQRMVSAAMLAILTNKGNTTAKKGKHLH